MPDLAQLEAFHFLRPFWLWGLVAVLLLFVLLRRRTDPDRQWKGFIAPHLIAHLKVGSTRRFRLSPLPLLAMGLGLGVLGLAGPTWEQEVSPFAEDTAPLVIALDLSQTMDAVDVQPSRLERAKQKIRDLLALRPGARTALIAYAGTAHSVLPLADDAAVIETFLDGLSTDLMPEGGKDPVEALALAEEILARDSVPGSILFLTDGIGAEDAPTFADHRARTRDEVMVLAVGTTGGGPIPLGGNRFATDAQGRRIVATLDREGLDALAQDAGVFVGSVTVNDDDVNRIQSRIQTHLQVVQQEDPSARWKDLGYWLVFPVLLLSLFWFRRGWTVRWSLTLLVLGLSGCSPASSGSFRFADLWLTPDQQGRYDFDREDFATAGDRFEDPLWKGVSYFRAGDPENAILQFARSDLPEAHFNLGNCYAYLGDFEAAVASYEAALRGRPDWVEARENRDMVQALIPTEEEAGDPPAQTGPPSFDPDEVQFDERGEKGEEGEVEAALLSDDQITEMWMRRLQASPAEFLRRRFFAEAEARRLGGGS